MERYFTENFLYKKHIRKGPLGDILIYKLASFWSTNIQMLFSSAKSCRGKKGGGKKKKKNTQHDF